jgi:hypothetical protein
MRLGGSPCRATQVGGLEGRDYRGRTRRGFCVASFRIVPRRQKPALGDGALSRLVRRAARSATAGATARRGDAVATIASGQFATDAAMKLSYPWTKPLVECSNVSSPNQPGRTLVRRRLV